MSHVKRIEATKDSVEKLQEFYEMKALAVQNVPLNCFHDARSSLTSIETQVHLQFYSLPSVIFIRIYRLRNSMLIQALRFFLLLFVLANSTTFSHNPLQPI